MVFCYLKRGRGREDMGFLYVAEDGLVALLMESMHLECSVEREREREREIWGHAVKIFLLPFFFFFELNLSSF